MSAFYDSKFITSLKNNYIVIDTNVLGICSTDPHFMSNFRDIFKDVKKLLDPIVKLEFLKGAQTDSLFKKKESFLEYHEFYEMTDHQEIYRHVYANSLDIARIYSHHERSSIKTGDVFIIARLMLYPTYYFMTLDKSDFTSLLFDRIGIVSMEHNTPQNKADSLELVHICILKFSEEKFRACKRKLHF